MLEELIERIIEKKSGNKEFALFYFGDEGPLRWRADVGCGSSNVTLGEVAAEFEAWDSTAVDAVRNLLKLLRLSDYVEDDGGHPLTEVERLERDKAIMAGEIRHLARNYLRLHDLLRYAEFRIAEPQTKSEEQYARAMLTKHKKR